MRQKCPLASKRAQQRVAYFCAPFTTHFVGKLGSWECIILNHTYVINTWLKVSDTHMHVHIHTHIHNQMTPLSPPSGSGIQRPASQLALQPLPARLLLLLPLMLPLLLPLLLLRFHSHTGAVIVVGTLMAALFAFVHCAARLAFVRVCFAAKGEGRVLGKARTKSQMPSMRPLPGA